VQTVTVSLRILVQILQKLLAESLRWLFLDKSIFNETNDTPKNTNVYLKVWKYVYLSAYG